MTSLEVLSLAGTPITRCGIERLHALKPKTNMYWGASPFNANKMGEDGSAVENMNIVVRDLDDDLAPGGGGGGFF